MPIQIEGAVALPSRPASRRASWHARTRRVVVQGAIIAAVAATLAYLGFAIREGLARHGVSFSFGFLDAPAGFGLSEGLTLASDEGWPVVRSFVQSDSNAQALVAGLVNTLKVAVAGIVLSTVLGTVLGVGRLSTNWIVRKASFAAVEFVRNTPLLIQIVFWYFAVVLQFPPAAHAARLMGVVVSQQGVYLPSLVASASASEASSTALILAALALAAALRLPRPAKARRVLFLAGAGSLVASAIAGFPLAVEFPRPGRFSTSGGIAMSPEMSALLLAIVVNSGSYIAEIVRGTIESTPRGQWEAASALGMGRGLMLREIILPQVFRIVLPSFANQYISLVKNTALGIAIGYPDLFSVNGTVANQTGRSLEGVIIVMVTYLVLSWTISGAVNYANTRLQRGTTR